MEKRTIEISLETAKEWYNSDNESLKQVALQAFKEEELKDITYKDICNELLNKYGYGFLEIYSKNKGIVPTSKKQLEKILAIIKLMNVAKYLNGSWTPDWDDCSEYKFHIYSNDQKLYTGCTVCNSGCVYFKSYEIAQKAIEILGEDTICLALSTDW